MSFDKLNRKWDDISSEEWRIYTFPDGKVKISNPQHLNVSKTGSHRILDKDGVSHYVPTGWIHIKWKAEPAFVK